MPVYGGAARAWPCQWWHLLNLFIIINVLSVVWAVLRWGGFPVFIYDCRCEDWLSSDKPGFNVDVYGSSACIVLCTWPRESVHLINTQQLSSFISHHYHTSAPLLPASSLPPTSCFTCGSSQLLRVKSSDWWINAAAESQRRREQENEKRREREWWCEDGDWEVLSW